MSVIIKDFKMPDGCLQCPMQWGGFCGVVPAWVDEGRVAPTVEDAAKQGKAPWCPLIEVPQLDSIAIGKIVDIFRDRLIEAKAHEYIKKPYAWALYQTWKEIDERGV